MLLWIGLDLDFKPCPSISPPNHRFGQKKKRKADSLLGSDLLTWELAAASEELAGKGHPRSSPRHVPPAAHVLRCGHLLRGDAHGPGGCPGALRGTKPPGDAPGLQDGFGLVDRVATQNNFRVQRGAQNGQPCWLGGLPY